jgi:uncharacterized membrane protein
MLLDRFSARAPSNGGSTLRTIAKTVLALVIIGELVAIAVLARNDTEPPSRGSGRARIETESDDAGTYSNPAAGYSFDYPDSWKLEPDGTVTKISSPDGNTVISLGPGAGSDPLTASEKLTVRLENAYDSVDLSNREVVSVGDELGVVLEGKATNRSGARLRFRVAAVQGPDHGWAVTGFTSGPEARLQAIFDRVLDTFSVSS